MNNDHLLLHDYAHKGDEAAFAQLVERHANLVYGTALRHLNGNTSLAEDVAQQVFIDLARKAGELSPRIIVAGWLHKHTCFLARNALRSRCRRLTRETEAFAMNTTLAQPGRPGPDLGRELDDALEALPEKDRNLLILRFLNQQDLRTAGEALGLSEDAAQKRVARALGRLRVIFARRGHPVSDLALVAILAGAATMAAPSTCAATIIESALAYGVGSASPAASAGGTLLEAGLMKKTHLFLVALLAAGVIIPFAMHQRISALEEERELFRLSARAKVPARSQEPTLTVTGSTSLTKPASGQNTAASTPFRSREIPAEKRKSRSLNTASAGSMPSLTVQTNAEAAAPWFTIEGSIPVTPGATVITGGWELKPGKRYFAMVTPTTQSDGMILIQSRLLGVETEAAKEAGLDGLITDQANAENYGLTDKEETRNLIAHLESLRGFEILSSPSMITGPGTEAEIQVGEEIRLRFTPHVAANGTDIALDMKGAVKSPKVE